MKRHFFIAVLFLAFISTGVQAQPPEHIPLMNKYWELLSTRTIKKNLKSGLYEPFFPPALAAINNTNIALPGYMVPLKTAAMHQTFLLSVLPIMQCEFCGEGDIPEMVEVFMAKPIKFHKKPITIQGKLLINGNNPDGSTFQLQNAVMKE
jgi:hypothetical protein